MSIVTKLILGVPAVAHPVLRRVRLLLEFFGLSLGALLLSLSVSGCGGGGSGGSGGDPPPDPVVVDPDDDDDGGQIGDTSQCDDDSALMFQEVTDALGLCYESDEGDYTLVPTEEGGSSVVLTSGGLALSHMDADREVLWLYVTRGAGLEGQLFEYLGEEFLEASDRNGIDPSGHEHASYFLDLDNDGDKDFISIQYHGVIEVFENDGTNEFALKDGNMGLRHLRTTIGLTAGDYDLDGDLDLFFTHWGGAFSTERPVTEYLWRNEGNGRLSDFSDSVDLQTSQGGIAQEWSFTPIFSDLDFDGYPDMLIASDFGTSQVMMNRGGQFFENVTDASIDDENGMGADVGDVDFDGDFDWFVTSITSHAPIVDPNYDAGDSGLTGNRMYINVAQTGTFVDVSETAGVRDGYWGWGACLADFNNDVNLDIFHTNGFGEGSDDPSRLFMSNGDGTYTEDSVELGIDHQQQGRAVACWDYNDDGNVDIFIGNHANAPTVYENTGSTDDDADNNFLKVHLKGLDPNPDAFGSRIAVRTAESEQLREMRSSAGFLTQKPAEVHFGLGEDDIVLELKVTWPTLDKAETQLFNVAVNQTITIEQPEPAAPSLIVTHGDGTGIYEPGATVEISAHDVRENYFFSHWTASGDIEFKDRFSTTTTIVMPSEAVNIDANFLPGVPAGADVSPIRRWNEVLLQAIRLDFARPTVHARNLFHASAAIYDAWVAATDDVAATWLLGREQAGFSCEFDIEMASSSDDATVEAASYAAYRLMRHRFKESPGFNYVTRDTSVLMDFLGFDEEFDSRDLDPDVPATLGNHIAWCYIEMGLGDGSNEANLYVNQHYEPVNPAFDPNNFGNDELEDFNRWQPISLPEFLDQSGNRTNSTPEFLGAEWGDVWPFSLQDSDLEEFERDDGTYKVYHDPGVPPEHGSALEDLYQWGFSLVAIWSAHLDPDETEEWDISPASLGNIDIDDFPTQFEDFEEFYDRINGGDTGRGYHVNPATLQPYTPQLVPRGDYARVLAEFWADGPESETPPGHWFVILNAVNSHPDLERRMEGQGAELSKLEWDIKSYMLLGGAMHDSAISAWSIKGWHDYIRPVSAIRGMARLGQSSDAGDVSYDPGGMPLEPGYIEIVREGDALAGENDEHVGRIKIKAWRGPTQIENAEEEYAGVDWILAEEWWPYQRPSFVTPPFSGYVSGHSTYSRAAADTLTRLTGDRYFPGGMSGFHVEQDHFLKFERGPSKNMTLEWATYQDASDQCSLSRIWGGIHPPADDLPGRLIGEKIAVRANDVAFDLFDGIVED